MQSEIELEVDKSISKRQAPFLSIIGIVCAQMACYIDTPTPQDYMEDRENVIKWAIGELKKIY